MPEEEKKEHKTIVVEIDNEEEGKRNVSFQGSWLFEGTESEDASWSIAVTAQDNLAVRHTIANTGNTYLTVYEDLEEAELCYAPQYGSAKDPVNMAGMIASNLLRGYSSVAHWEDLAESNAYVLDVREPSEFKRGHVKMLSISI